MGCRTGFYMSVIGKPSLDNVKEAWEDSMRDVLRVKNQEDIPELNIYQCGTAAMHSLNEAQDIASKVLDSGIGIMNTEELLLKDIK